MNLKRDNWTNAEVIKMIEDMTICQIGNDGKPDISSECCRRHNRVVAMIADHFRSHFACSEDTFGALALDTETGEVFHVGCYPKN